MPKNIGDQPKYVEDAKVFYYGKRPEWTKYHKGWKVEDDLNDDGTYWVRSVCGSPFPQEGEGERPPIEFDPDTMCRSCHRTFAWELMVNTMMHQQKVELETADKIEGIVAQAKRECWETTKILSELLDLEDDLRRDHAGVTRAQRPPVIPTLKLVRDANGA